MKLEISIFKKVIPILLLSILIFYFSHQEQAVVEFKEFEYSDKVMHLIAYFIYGLAVQYFLTIFTLTKKLFLLFTLLIGGIYGASDEFHQSFVAGRQADVYDFLADFLGVLLSLIFINKFHQNEKVS